MKKKSFTNILVGAVSMALALLGCCGAALAQEPCEEGYHFTEPEVDLFSLDASKMSDEEISHLVLSLNERDVKAWIESLTDQEREDLLARDTALSKSLDVYIPDDDGNLTHESYITYADYLSGIEEMAGYKFTSTSGVYYVNWYLGSVSEGQSAITVSGMTKGDKDDVQQTKLTWKISNGKHSLTLKDGCSKSWPITLTSAQNETNYQQVFADFTYVKPISYKAAVTYDTANDGAGDYRIYQGTHDSDTGCLKKNPGSGAKYYIAAGTNYMGTDNYQSATTETFNIGPNFSNLGCTDSNTNTNTVARITLNPVYMTLTWNQNGGSGSNCQPASVLYGNTHTQATSPSRAGYTFTGWGGYSAGTGVTANKTYTAGWSANRYKISYLANGGTLSKSEDQVTFGGNIPAMPTASRTGYTFTSWSWSGYSGSGSYSYVGDSTAAANWKANQYTIRYDANGGMVSPESNSVTFDQPCPTAPTPVRKGYTFTGWSGGTFAGTYQTAGDTTLRAGWEANTYTVSFNTDGGSSVSDINATYDKEFLLPAAPAKQDYAFAGWSDGVNTFAAGAKVKNLTSEKGDKVTFKAEWVPSTFVICFDSNGGGEVSDIKYSFGENTALPVPGRAEETEGKTVIKYTFDGWVDSKGNVYTTAQDVKKDSPFKEGKLYLTARWAVSKSTTGESKIEKTIIEKQGGETNNYTNNYSMTDEQAQAFLEKLSKGIASRIIIGGVSYEVIRNADGSVTIRLIDLGNAKEVTIPDAIRFGDMVIPVTVIDKDAFRGNTRLERVIFGKNITTIRESAFEGCTNLKEVRLNDGLLEIQARAFRNCRSLKSITIPRTVLKIGDKAFENCVKLKTLKFAEGSVLSYIGKSAFAGCKALKSVRLPGKLTVLSSKAFYNCVKLSKVTGGRGLISIGAKAFMNCKSLKKITLYTNVCKIGKKAFYGCRKLKKVTIRSRVLTNVGSAAFKKTHKKIIFYVPDAAKKAAYKKLLKGKF